MIVLFKTYNVQRGFNFDTPLSRMKDIILSCVASDTHTCILHVHVHVCVRTHACAYDVHNICTLQKLNLPQPITND